MIIIDEYLLRMDSNLLVVFLERNLMAISIFPRSLGVASYCTIIWYSSI